MRAASLACIGLLACILPTAAQDVDKQSFEIIERGRYLAVAGDCTACHTPIGGKLFSGGRPLATPFGILLAPNITSDQTGIGDWTPDDLYNLLHNGIGRGGIHIYPAMPYTYYTRMTRDDSTAILAYLKSTDPVHNEVQSNQLPFPLNIRTSLIAWNALFFTPGEFKPDPSKSAAWNRGAYLVEGPEHCGMCHTPKNLLGADKGGAAYQGYSLQGWVAPNLTGDKRAGLSAWTEEDIYQYLATGRNRFDIASGPMAEAVQDSTSHLTESDLRAMATYIKDQPASGGDVRPVAASDPAMQQGQAIYVDQCAACHTMRGDGIVGLFPRLSGAPLVQQSDPESLIHVVVAGSRAVATDAAPTGPGMPTFDWKFSDDQIAAVLTYIRNSWGNAAPAVTASTVHSARASLHESPQ